MEYFRNFEVSGYLLGAISTGYISDKKIGEISKCHCNTVNGNVCVMLQLILRNEFGNVKWTELP
jgi:hypothetical protein